MDILNISCWFLQLIPKYFPAYLLCFSYTIIFTWTSWLLLVSVFSKHTHLCWLFSICLPFKVHPVKATVFPVVMYGLWELDHKESWVQNNRCFRTVVLEKTLESPLDCREIKPVNPKGNQARLFTGRTDAEAPILWPLDAKNWLTGKDPDVEKTDGRRRRGQQRIGSLVQWPKFWKCSWLRRNQATDWWGEV